MNYKDPCLGQMQVKGSATRHSSVSFPSVIGVLRVKVSCTQQLYGWCMWGAGRGERKWPWSQLALPQGKKVVKASQTAKVFAPEFQR